MTTFVLIAGSGHGGWAWRKVANLLREANHRVYTPSLTGLAEHSHLSSFPIGLDTHIQDVVKLFRWEDINEATLVGHSYAGWVISGAVEHLEKQVNRIAFVDAFLPDDGQTGFDLLNDQQKAAFSDAQGRGETVRPGPTSAALKIQSPDDAVWVDSMITPQPLGVSLQPVRLTGARERVPAKLYVRTPLFPQPLFDVALRRCEQDSTWQTAVMPDSGHDPMIDQPEALAKLLMDLR